MGCCTSSSRRARRAVTSKGPQQHSPLAVSAAAIEMAPPPWFHTSMEFFQTEKYYLQSLNQDITTQTAEMRAARNGTTRPSTTEEELHTEELHVTTVVPAPAQAQAATTTATIEAPQWARVLFDTAQSFRNDVEALNRRMVDFAAEMRSWTTGDAQSPETEEDFRGAAGPAVAAPTSRVAAAATSEPAWVQTLEEVVDSALRDTQMLVRRMQTLRTQMAAFRDELRLRRSDAQLRAELGNALQMALSNRDFANAIWRGRDVRGPARVVRGWARTNTCHHVGRDGERCAGQWRHGGATRGGGCHP